MTFEARLYRKGSLNAGSTGSRLVGSPARLLGVDGLAVCGASPGCVQSFPGCVQPDITRISLGGLRGLATTEAAVAVC